MARLQNAERPLPEPCSDPGTKCYIGRAGYSLGEILMSYWDEHFRTVREEKARKTESAHVRYARKLSDLGLRSIIVVVPDECADEIRNYARDLRVAARKMLAKDIEEGQ